MSALGQVAGAASYTNGLISPSNKIGLPDRVLPEPLSRNLRHPTMEAPDADSAPAPFSYRYTTLRDSTPVHAFHIGTGTCVPQLR